MGLDPYTIVFQLLNFFVLAWLLNRFLFRPALQRVRDHDEDMHERLQALADERRALAARREELEKQLEDHHALREETVAKAQMAAEAERREILEQARREVDELLEEGRREAQREQRQVMLEFRNELVNTVLDVAGNLVRTIALPEVQDALLRQLTDRIWTMGRENIDRVEALRRSLSGQVPVARVRSAAALSNEQQDNLAQVIAALADRPLNVQFETDPSLIAGLLVQVGDLVLDHTVADQLSELGRRFVNSNDLYMEGVVGQ